MGRKNRPSLNQIEIEAWKDLVIFTTLLMGAEYQLSAGYWVANDGETYGWTRFECARKWLWKKGMCVRKDGSIYQTPTPDLPQE